MTKKSKKAVPWREKLTNAWQKCYVCLVMGLPVALFFSYYPLIYLGHESAMNLEFSVALIYLVIFDIFSILGLVLARKMIFQGFSGWKWLFLSLFFPVWGLIQLFWAKNPLRAGLTSGVILAIYVAIWSLIIILPTFLSKFPTFWQKFWQVFFIGAGVVVFWCLIQSLLDVFGVQRDKTLMCKGCTSEMFGFPHPNGFAIEPQFMGNLLIFPSMMALYFWMKKSSCGRGLRAIFFIFGLFLTMSRGAIYGFLVGIMIWGLDEIWLFLKERRETKNGGTEGEIDEKWAKTGQKLTKKGEIWRKIGKMGGGVGIVLTSFLLALNLQGWMAENSVTNDTYVSGVAKVISQLTLGKIELTEVNEGTTLEASEPESEGRTAAFDGYVEDSTNTRLYLAEAGLLTWEGDAARMLAGVGLGGAGMAMNEAGFIATANEIVQNEYISLLLESGIIGVILLILSIFAIFRLIFAKKNQPEHDLGPLLGLMAAFLVTICFFSGIPNSAHIPIFVVILAMYLRLNREKMAKA